MAELVQEKEYIIYENSKGRLLIMIRSHFSDKADNPEIIYDGMEHALLFKTDREVVILDYIAENIRDKLLKSDEVLISEYRIIDEGNAENRTAEVIEDYYAKVRVVKKLPLNNDNLIKIEDLEEKEDIKAELSKYTE